MKNFVSIFPGVLSFRNYFSSVRYKLKSKRLLLGSGCSLGQVEFGGYNAVGDACSIQRSKIGAYTYISRNCRLQNCVMGSYGSVGPNCLIGLGKHPVDGFLSTHPVFYSTRKQNGITFTDRDLFEEFQPVEIGSDVWIGANVIILDGVKIGHGAIIAAGSIVNRNVEPFEIVGGVPVKNIRYRFEEDTVKRILASEWWSKPLPEIKRIKEELGLK